MPQCTVARSIKNSLNWSKAPGHFFGLLWNRADGCIWSRQRYATNGPYSSALNASDNTEAEWQRAGSAVFHAGRISVAAHKGYIAPSCKPPLLRLTSVCVGCPNWTRPLHQQHGARYLFFIKGGEA